MNGSQPPKWVIIRTISDVERTHRTLKASGGGAEYFPPKKIYNPSTTLFLETKNHRLSGSFFPKGALRGTLMGETLHGTFKELEGYSK